MTLQRCSPCLIGLLGIIGCAGPRMEKASLVPRAEFDLNCPAAQLRIITIDDQTQGVTGCGKRATYLEICDLTGYGPMNCRWVLNSAENPRGGGAAEQTVTHSMPAPMPPPMPIVPPPMH